jgi:hypothetical protein
MLGAIERNMKELTLHIGLPKTGTTTLQKYLTDNAEELEKQGVSYPKAGRSYIAHHNIAHACRRTLSIGREFNELRNNYDAEVASFDRAILSSEAFQNASCYLGLIHFFGLPNGLRKKLPASLPLRTRQYRISTYCYVREFLEFACSSYSQKVQNSNTHLSFTDFCRTQFRRPLRYLTSFWTWFSDETSFNLFDRSKLRNENIVHDFFWRTGIDMPSQEVTRDANPTISGNLLIFKLILNSHKLHTRRVYRALSELASEDAAHRGRFRIMDDTAHKIRMRFPDYNKVIQNLVGEVPLKSFEHEKPLFDERSWKCDLEKFLAQPKLFHLRDNPDIRRAISDHAFVRSLHQEILR